jgi:hypothetical protein
VSALDLDAIGNSIRERMNNAAELGCGLWCIR